MDLREAAEKQLVEGINKAFDEVTVIRDELRKLRGVEDFSALDDAALVSYSDHFRRVNSNFPIVHLVLVILTSQLKDQISEEAS